MFSFKLSKLRDSNPKSFPLVLALMSVGYIGLACMLLKDRIDEGISLYNQGKCDGAKIVLEESLVTCDELINMKDVGQMGPRKERIWHWKGLALQKLGRDLEAQECFDKSKELGYVEE